MTTFNDLSGKGEAVAWIRMDHLRQAQQAPFLCRVEPSFRPGFDLVPIYLTAPQAECAPREVQFCKHCNVNYPYHDLDCPVAVAARAAFTASGENAQAAPTPERAQESQP
jgi:hypothetical protein